MRDITQILKKKRKIRTGEDQEAAVQMSSTVIPLCKALEDDILPVECALMPSGVSIPDERYTCETASHSQCDRLETAESRTWKTEEMRHGFSSDSLTSFFRRQATKQSGLSVKSQDLDVK